MARVNRRIVKDILETGGPLMLGVERSVGKTTGAVFEALASSYQNPGKPVRVADKDINSEVTAKHTRDHARRIINMLGYTDIVVEIKTFGNNANTVLICNNFAEVI